MKFDGNKIRGLYAITPEPSLAKSFDQIVQNVRGLLQAGVSVLQYRDKSTDPGRRLSEASALAELCRHHQATFLINDDLALARTVGADGVHLGQNDVSLLEARAYLGTAACIGISCYNSYTRALAAQEAGADYIALGSVFPSSVKPNAVRAELSLLENTVRNLRIPVVAIGGITLANGLAVVATGVQAVAMISELFVVAAPEEAIARANVALSWFSKLQRNALTGSD